MFLALTYVACNSENRRQRQLTFETFILAPNFTMPDVMPPADCCSISRLAVPFQFCIFGGFGNASQHHTTPVHIKLNHYTLFSTIHNRFDYFMLC